MKIKNNGFDYVFSKTGDGNMSYTWVNKNEVDINRGRFLKKYLFVASQCVKSLLVHGTRIKVFT